jgi:hypothetical protein
MRRLCQFILVTENKAVEIYSKAWYSLVYVTKNNDCRRQRIKYEIV